jgi:predicted metal-dependent peptidase
MTEIHDPRLQAEGRIAMAIRRMAAKYVFHAGILERFRLREQPSVATMGVMATKTEVLLLFNTDFVLNLQMDQLVGVLLHEVHHVLFRHIFRDPDDYPDEWARVVAEEITVNEFVTEPLPAGVILLEQFPQFPPLESTDERYRRLRRRTRRVPLELPEQWATKPDRSTAIDAEGHPPDDDSESGPNQEFTGRIIDDHSVWQAVAPSQKDAEAVVETIIQDAYISAGADNVPADLEDAISSWGIGTQPGTTREELSSDRDASVDWRRLLRRYIGRELVQRPVFNRPPRRFPDLVGILPGRRRQPGRLTVMAVIDTSGSISTEMLEIISSELHRMARDYQVTVVECDCEIQDVYPFRPLTSVGGRGGTDFRPPLEQSFLRRHCADLVVYFTDGEGPAPERPPHVPVIWCLLQDGQQPAEWGQIIRMHAAD